MKKLTGTFILSIPLFFSANALALTEADWSRNVRIESGENRENILQLNAEEMAHYKSLGIKHALQYPVTVTGLLIPYQPLLNFFKADTKNPLKKLAQDITKSRVGFKNEEELYQWLGLNKFNPPTATGIYQIPFPNGKKDQFYVGAGLVKTSHGEGLTFSCFTCHSGNLFGTTVMGLTNKRVKANKFFHMAKKTVPYIPSQIFKAGSGATVGETEMFKRTKNNLWSVGAVEPQVLGLDTSLPQVALSLTRRNSDAYATKNEILEKFPKSHELDTYVADSKPMVWWTLKYKTRWLADGSIVSGNPIFTNILWNELGRGADLKELENWMKNNKEAIDALTVAAFATKPPRWTDFYPANSINLEKAIRGQNHFRDSCMKCHGDYVKGWEMGDETQPIEKQLETVKVDYFETTPVKDVGTDPQRRLGIETFATELNNLQISKWMKTVLEPQPGYVPPPLDGIWSRYPYLHNNSIPNLCALMTPPAKRPVTFVQGPADDRHRDYDTDCVGYPVGNKMPKSWNEDKEAFFDTRKPGLKNIGHYQMFLKDDGSEKYTEVEKSELREFLKTL